MNKQTCCAFTGHRNLKNDLDINALTAVIKRLVEEGITTFLNGMARGFDLVAAQCVLNLKKDYPYIKLIACVPCPNQEKYYSQEDKKTYYKVLERCDEVKIISKHYYNACMLVRDRYMVDNCTHLIAYYRGEEGGTEYTLRYADDKDIEIYGL
ncbi:MAG: SLOG family protein [Candidatus Coproplasma sp.]